MPPEMDWRTPPDEAGGDTLAYPDIAMGYLSRNARYRADYTRTLRKVKRGAMDADEATTTLPHRARSGIRSEAGGRALRSFAGQYRPGSSTTLYRGGTDFRL